MQCPAWHTRPSYFTFAVGSRSPSVVLLERKPLSVLTHFSPGGGEYWNACATTGESSVPVGKGLPAIRWKGLHSSFDIGLGRGACDTQCVLRHVLWSVQLRWGFLLGKFILIFTMIRSMYRKNSFINQIPACDLCMWAEPFVLEIICNILNTVSSLFLLNV